MRFVEYYFGLPLAMIVTCITFIPIFQRLNLRLSLDSKYAERTSSQGCTYLAGKSGKLNMVTTEVDWKDQYNIWSGLVGGFFLALSYLGPDKSQGVRYNNKI